MDAKLIKRARHRRASAQQGLDYAVRTGKSLSIIKEHEKELKRLVNLVDDLEAQLGRKEEKK